MIDDEEPVRGDDDVETEYRVDNKGRAYGVFKPKPKIDQKVAYFVFDRDAQEDATRIRHLNSLGAVGALEAKAKHDALKATLSRAQHEYALWASENPWTVPGYLVPEQPKRSWFSGAVLFATTLIAAAVVAFFIRSSSAPHPTPSIEPPTSALPPESAPPEPAPRQGRVARRTNQADINRIANVY